MNIVLTGGTGFLGSHTAEALTAAGHALRCTVRRTSDTRWLDPLGVETVELDLGSLAREPGRRRDDPVRAVMAEAECVVHCGALTRAPSEDRFLEVNAEGTSALAAAAAAAGVRRFVFVSSLAARGPDGATGPISPYGRSKARAEGFLADLGDSDEAAHMEIVVLRPGGVYGPRDSDLLPLFSMAARGVVVVPASRVPLQPVYVSDVVSAVVAAVRAAGSPAPGPPADPLPVAHPSLHSWGGLAAALAAAVGGRARVVRLPSAVFWTAGLVSEIVARVGRGDPAMDRRRARDMSHHRWTCDIERTRRDLGWAPAVDMEEGLRLTAEWYREAGWL